MQGAWVWSLGREVQGQKKKKKERKKEIYQAKSGSSKDWREKTEDPVLEGTEPSSSHESPQHESLNSYI